MIRTVLMVCEGNICRSPLAAALLARELPHIDVASAGTHALVGERAHEVIAEIAHAQDCRCAVRDCIDFDYDRINCG